MNLNRIVNMVMRVILRRVIGKGVNAGFNAVGQRWGKGQQLAQHGAAPDHAQATKRKRQARRRNR